MSKKLIVSSAIIILVEVFLNSLGVFSFWYIKYWWLDILTHFIGGFWLSLTAIWFLFFSDYVKLKISFWRMFTLGLFSVLVVAFVWEIFEYCLRSNFSLESYWFDTIVDIIAGTFGGALSSTVVAHLWKKNLN